MIVVRVELWSAVTGQVSELARMTIDNVGGTAQSGDYRVRTVRGRSAQALNRAMAETTVQREGKVLGHPRLREHVWNLVAKGLTGLGYGNGGRPLMARATLTASLRALEVIRDGNAAVLKAHGHVDSAFASTVITDNAILVTLELAAAVKAAAAGDTAPALAAVENLALHEMELR